MPSGLITASFVNQVALSYLIGSPLRRRPAESPPTILFFLPRGLCVFCDLSDGSVCECAVDEILLRTSSFGRERPLLYSSACLGCGWESLMKSVTLGNVTMSHRTRERPAECLASLSHSTMIGLPRAQH
ncbi:hypothetical protein EVAR_60620_1 [Eumeta japonica]|uniref:Uncharacterized protein n=1 Tax=Eumeta variegata TaxID=151549 RepID=A0A4C1YBD0_EUMVA|nr:hypothetical protein EVAR_60620_1 [Eumeta japonica]